MIGGLLIGHVGGDDACGRIISQCHRPLEEMIGQTDYGVHAGEQFVAIFQISRTLPFSEPVGGIPHPVGTYPQSCGSRTRVFLPWLCETHGVESI